MSIGAEHLSCQELVELVTSYFERALPELDRARFEEHLTRCDGCTQYVEQMRHTIRVTGELQASDLSPEMERKLLVAFRDWRRS
jgi:predicted anti-sigma-YlaC factor YlaD